MAGADRRQFLVGACALALASTAEAKGAAAPHLTATQRAEIPRWARLQRKLLDANAAACRAFYDKYFDARGWLMAYPRWGANDGPDDAIENFNDWPLLHMLGASDEVKALYTRGWNGHIDQYSQARTTEVEFGRNGMYRKEFLTMSDWQHHGEGMTLFAMAGLSDPRSPDFLRRARTYAGFYMGDDPAAPNWDPEHRLIRSLLNGSLGPLLRPATPLDWAGDPFNTDGFKLEHGEDSYPQMLEHFRDYGEVVGDHPLNLVSTTLAFNAYMATGERRYRDWVISYVDAWVERAARNGGVLPSNVGLDGSIGGAAGGRWWGGAYGWGFSPVNPATGKREDRNRVPRAIIGFMNAYLLTGDDKYLQVWRTQADVINAQSKMIDGRL